MMKAPLLHEVAIVPRAGTPAVCDPGRLPRAQTAFLLLPFGCFQVNLNLQFSRRL